MRTGHSACAPHGVEDVHPHDTAVHTGTWVLHALSEGVQAAAGLPEEAPGDDVLAVRDEGEGEVPQPPHHLAAICRGAVLDDVVLRHHLILWKLAEKCSGSGFGRKLSSRRRDQSVGSGLKWVLQHTDSWSYEDFCMDQGLGLYLSVINNCNIVL